MTDELRPVRVVIADDESLVRAGIRAIVDSSARIEVVGEAGNGHDAIELVRAERPEVAILDIRMPGVDGIEATTEIRGLGVGTAVVILTTFGTDENVAQALAGGADGFLLKASAPQDLIEGVLAVARGGSALAPHVAKLLVRRLRDSPDADAERATGRVAELTDRERDVLALLGRGRSNAEIAGQLWISESTVKGHVTSILQRLGADNRVQAAIVAYEAGMVAGSDH